MSLKQNLISWWKLDEQSGTRNDAHGTNHLSDNNTVLYAAGKQGDAADFEKDNIEYLSIADNASLNTGGHTDFTFACWARPESIPAVNAFVGAKWDKGDDAASEWSLELYSDTRLYFNVISGTGAYLSATGPTISLNTWYFIVAWHDATTNKINIQVNNGTAASVNNTNGINTGATSPLYLGGAYNQYSATNISPFDGLIDEAAFWKRVLTADERTWLYNSGNGRTYEELASGCIFGLLGIFGGIVR